MIDCVRFELNINSADDAVISDPLNPIADALQKHLVDRLRAGADYGKIRDVNGNTIGQWWMELDEEDEEEMFDPSDPASRMYENEIIK